MLDKPAFSALILISNTYDVTVYVCDVLISGQ